MKLACFGLTVALLAAEQREHPVFPLDKALFLFQSEHLLAHLRFPQLDELVGEAEPFDPLGLVPAELRCLAQIPPGHHVREGVVVDGLVVLVRADHPEDVRAAAPVAAYARGPVARRLREELASRPSGELGIAGPIEITARGPGDVGDDVPDLRRGDALAARHHPDLAQAAGTDVTRPSMYTLDPRSRALMSNFDRDPILLTPGPLTTTLTTKAAMLRDWGSWDSNFNTVTREVRDKLTKGTRIQCGLDAREHPIHCHHEKIIVVDDQVAFVGGIDLTELGGDRFDATLGNALAGLRADRVEGVEVAEPRRGFHLCRDMARLEPVDLVERDHDRHTQIEQAPRDVPVARADPLARREDEEHAVDVLERAVHRPLHARRQRIERTLEARQVGEHELRAVDVHDPEDAPSRRLRLVGDDRHLVPAQRVHERGLAHVRPPGDRHDAGLQTGRSHVSGSRSAAE